MSYEDVISVENFLAAWSEFSRGKRSKPDVQRFERNFIDNILSLHLELAHRSYRHGGYESFNISDPKPRNIHKASVRDRLLHHAIYRVLYPFFDRTFITDSYSCRIGKGTHKALARFQSFGRKAGKNNTKTCWVLKCDIKKFFANIDHEVLITILQKRIADSHVLWLLREIIGSFHSTREGVGLPLGNLTSQLLVNIYMNEFDQFVKQTLKVKYYIRYADDFAFLSYDKKYPENLLPKIQAFLTKTLHLALHPDKVFVKTLASGIDFLGWVHFPDHRVLRSGTKQRMFKRISEHPSFETIQSYLGLLRHGNTEKLKNKIRRLG